MSTPKKEIRDCPVGKCFEPRPLLSICQVDHGPRSQWRQFLRDTFSRSSVNQHLAWVPNEIPVRLPLRRPPSLFFTSHLVVIQYS